MYLYRAHVRTIICRQVNGKRQKWRYAFYTSFKHKAAVSCDELCMHNVIQQPWKKVIQRCTFKTLQVNQYEIL
jgi:hypothetical protein